MTYMMRKVRVHDDDKISGAEIQTMDISGSSRPGHEMSVLCRSKTDTLPES